MQCKFFILFCLSFVLFACGGSGNIGENNNNTSVKNITQFLTTPDRTNLFTEVADQARKYNSNYSNTITIQRESPKQEIVGFGFALTGGSAAHIHAMSPTARSTLLNELFGTEGNSIGMSFIRISVGASDLDSAVFSYNDNASDIEHTGFSFGPHLDHLIPVLKEILAVNSDIKIMASPWSAPSWMKNNGSFKGGSLMGEHYATYAAYLVKYLDTMRQEGINIDYLSVQNEPLHDGNNPSMRMEAQDMVAFVKDHLGPAITANATGVKLIAYDHNPDNINYPSTVLSDEAAAQYLDGSAFHLYGGSIDALTSVHNAHPSKHIYFTEQWYENGGDFMGDFRWHLRNVIIGSMRNWSRSVIEWNLSSNSNLQPYTAGGCAQCLGAVTIDGDAVNRNSGYYVIAHASKFVRPGSTYLETSNTGSLHNAAFITPDNKIVLIVLNDSSTSHSFNIKEGNNTFSYTLDGGAAATFVWNAE